MSNHRLSIALLSATLLLATAPIAVAETQSVKVQSGDLNLARETDRTKLQYRVAHAVDTVCGSSHPRTTADAQAYATCSKTARAGAAVQYEAMVAKAQADMKVAGNH